MTERGTYVAMGISFMRETDQFSSLCVLSNAATPDEVRSKIGDTYGPLTLCPIYVETVAELAPYGCKEQGA